MSSVVSMVLNTVNAPYGTKVSAQALAMKIQNLASVASHDVHAFAFFSEVNPDLQSAFISEMGVNEAAAVAVAGRFSTLAGYKLPLAA